MNRQEERRNTHAGRSTTWVLGRYASKVIRNVASLLNQDAN
jgi:hypothetical protein